VTGVGRVTTTLCFRGLGFERVRNVIEEGQIGVPKGIPFGFAQGKFTPVVPLEKRDVLDSTKKGVDSKSLLPK
jgi:hypothetical protein